MSQDDVPAVRPATPAPQVMPVFMGAPWAQKYGGPGSNLTFREWKSQVEYLAGLQGLNEAQCLGFVLGSLEGEAKREVQAAPAEKRGTAAAVFDYLSQLYGDNTSMAILRSRFFNCKQSPGQSLRSFSLQLRELASQLQRRNDPSLGAGETLIRDQFILGLREGPIRQNLRLQLRQNPAMTFEQIRSEAIALEQDYAGSEEAPVCMAAHRVVEATAPPPEDWKLELRAQMQELTKQLIEAVSQVRPANPPPRERAYSDGGRDSQRHPTRPNSRLQWDEQGKPICLRCGKAGHISRFCTERRASQGGF